MDKSACSLGEAIADIPGGAAVMIRGSGGSPAPTDARTQPQLVKRRPLPPTGERCVTRGYTSLAVIDIENQRFVSREKLADLSIDDPQALAGADLHVGGSIADHAVPELS